eukprot:3065020-Pleurochrysis_carterae.AAC.1
MGAVNEKEVSVETMCVINAAIIFFLIAEGRGERAALLQQVGRPRFTPAPCPASHPPRPLHAMRPLSVAGPFSPS